MIHVVNLLAHYNSSSTMDLGIVSWDYYAIQSGFLITAPLKCP